MAPLVAAIRCSASIDADASTTKTIRLPIFRSRTFWRRSSRSSFNRSPARRPRSFSLGPPPLALHPPPGERAAILLHRRGRAHRGVDGEVVDLRLRLGAHVATAAVGRL